MKESINLDFCILKNPLNEGTSPIIFVTRTGEDFLDTSIIQEEDYEKAIYAIQNLGYIESDILTFEFSQDPDFPTIQQDKLIEVLENKGMKYNKELERRLIDDFNSLKSDETYKLMEGLNESIKNREERQGAVRFMSKKHSIFKIPEVGEKISLYFHLFLECKFKGDNCYLNFNGDFFTQEESDTKNFIQILKCDFIRLNNPYTPNKIILKSSLNNEEILEKVMIAKNGSFTKRDGDGVGKIFVYHIMEVKNSIPKNNRITIEIDSLENFDNMIQISRKIKQKQKTRLDSLHKTSIQIQTLGECSVVLDRKMRAFANNDEFEKAMEVKKDIEKVTNKISKLKEEPEEISLKLIEKKYCIGRK